MVHPQRPQLAFDGLPFIVGGLLALSTFFVALLLFSYQYKLQREIVYSDLARRQELLMEKLVARCTPASGAFRSSDLKPILERAMKEDPAGQVGLGVIDFADLMEVGVPSKELLKTLFQEAKEAQSFDRIRPYSVGPLNVIAKPIVLRRYDASGEERALPLGHVVGAFSPRDTEIRLRKVLVRSILLVLAGAAIGVGAAYWLSHRLIVRPILRLERAAHRIALRDYDISIEEAPVRELRTLGASFEKMAEKIRQFNAELQTKLEERTSELSRAQGQIVRSEKLAAIGQLASGVGHELRNPLGAIRNALFYVRDTIQGTPLAAKEPGLWEMLSHAESEIQSATAIINDLLDFSRAVTLQLEPSDLREVVSDLLKGMVVPADVRVEQRHAQNLPRVWLDRQRFVQALFNMAHNAVQAMPRGGVLEVSTALEGDPHDSRSKVRVVFKDTGMGIPPENLSRIFEPLFTTKAKGTGLGLPIAASIVAAHGGSISVDSEPGKGSSFVVHLPLGGPNHEKDISA